MIHVKLWGGPQDGHVEVVEMDLSTLKSTQCFRDQDKRHHVYVQRDVVHTPTYIIAFYTYKGEHSHVE